MGIFIPIITYESSGYLLGNTYAWVIPGPINCNGMITVIALVVVKYLLTYGYSIEVSALDLADNILTGFVPQYVSGSFKFAGVSLDWFFYE